MTVDTIHVYRAKDGWRWRMVRPNGRLMAESGEAYTQAFRCEQAAAYVFGPGEVEIVRDPD